MKKMRLLLGLVAVMLFSTATTSFAQGRFGADSAACVGYLNFYKDFYKQQNMKDAASLWRKAYSTCPPAASQFIFVDGRKIMDYLIANHKGDEAQKAQMVDTLLKLSEIRAEYYPKYAKSAKEFRLMDMIKYVNDDSKILSELDSYIREAGPNAGEGLFVITMQKAKSQYEASKISADDVLKFYTDFSPLLETKLAVKPDDEGIISAQAAFMDAFITSGVANCENLITVFTPRFKTNPTDISLVKTIAKLLSDNDCLNSDLFLQAVTALNNLEPSYNSAYLLYRLHSSKGNHEDALTFLQAAVDSEDSDAIKDGELMLDMATYYYKNMKNASKAVSVAKAAMDANPAMAGKANLLIGTIWGGLKCSGNEIEQRAKYWVAVDYLTRSKKDSETAEDAQKLISTYASYYPNVADAFMYDLTDGKSYSVSCSGLSATTTVRTSK